MQQVDGAYADPTMDVVLIPTDTPTEETMESLEPTGNTLITGTCTVVEDGGSITPVAGGSCFKLTVGTGADSTFTINTTGIAGVVIFAQHVPTEFERDTHYLFDAAGVDIEPVAQESGGGHAHHHAHAEEEACGCSAAEDGFVIDCTKPLVWQAAYDNLVANKCNAEDTCKENAQCGVWYVPVLRDCRRSL